jgi:hypothetical protein
MAVHKLLTPAHYTNWMPFEARATDNGLSIACRKMPRGAISLHAGIIAAGFCGFGWLTYSKAPDLFWATLALGTLTLGGFVAHVIWFHRSQQRRDPVLVYDRKHDTIGLPRELRTLRVDDVGCICLVQGRAAGEPVCQLQLHLQEGSQILLASGYRGSLDQMFETIAASVPVATCRSTEGREDNVQSASENHG